MSRKIYYHKLGCPKAEVDHEWLMSGLKARNAELVDSSDDADTIVISTCAFLEDARVEAVDAILEAVRWKDEDDSRRLYVTGCMPVRYGDELRKEIPEVDKFFNYNQWDTAIQEISSEELLEKTIGKSLPSFEIKSDSNISTIDFPGQVPLVNAEALSKLNRTEIFPHAYIKIAEGCNRRCAYCSIPDIRGNYQSRGIDHVLPEIEKVMDQGSREIILIAEEINSYGKDLHDGSSIIKLLPQAGKIVERYSGWLRVLYTHPPVFNEDFIKVLADTPALLPYIDYPVEHADDNVLKKMGRRTSWKEMRHWVDRMRETIPGIVIRSSIIVGHPGEGQKEFDNLLKRLDEVKFERLGVFCYSAEEGTRSFNERAVEREESLVRQEEVFNLALEQAENWYSGLIGKNVHAIIESVEDGVSYGRSVWDAPEIDGDAFFNEELPIGTIVEATVVDAIPFSLELKRIK